MVPYFRIQQCYAEEGATATKTKVIIGINPNTGVVLRVPVLRATGCRAEESQETVTEELVHPGRSIGQAVHFYMMKGMELQGQEEGEEDE